MDANPLDRPLDQAPSHHHRHATWEIMFEIVALPLSLFLPALVPVTSTRDLHDHRVFEGLDGVFLTFISKRRESGDGLCC
jgi:hypothetical protein